MSVQKEEVLDLNIYLDVAKKNKHQITCTKCPSIILKASEGLYSDEQISLPVMKTNAELKKQLADGKCKEGEIEFESLNNCWYVDDLYAFENVGVSNTVDGLKYLICADCEFGPVGVHYLANKKSYLALNRVNHKVNQD